jgi:hypothetical protein
LEDLSNLETLLLDGTGVTEAGVRALQEKLPKCKIYWESELEETE